MFIRLYSTSQWSYLRDYRREAYPAQIFKILILISLISEIFSHFFWVCFKKLQFSFLTEVSFSFSLLPQNVEDLRLIAGSPNVTQLPLRY